MKTAIASLVIVFLVFSFLKFYFNRKWKLFYTAFGSDNYFMVVAKLNAAGVKFKTNTLVNLRSDARFKDFTQYDIFVKEEDEHRAQAALRS
ncbi:hypothetical protein V7139_17770 [Neobacillus drentensis]|uniref:hypothetical protein n=1 Tax=Neobacillus drentensis TaxID=220684 RepID=UPI002FFEB4F9